MQDSRPKIELYQELVPLAEAAAAAWHVVSDRPEPLRDPRQLEEARGRMAIALSSVAPVLRKENGALQRLAGDEIDARLFARGASPGLEGLFIRRVDLLRAVESLKDARADKPRSGPATPRT